MEIPLMIFIVVILIAYQFTVVRLKVDLKLSEAEVDRLRELNVKLHYAINLSDKNRNRFIA